MACRVSLGQLIEILDATPVNLTAAALSQRAIGVVTDSRHLQPGEVFLALRGDRFDGHGFVPTVIQQGAIAAIVDRADDQAQLPLLWVKDTLQAYQAIAHWWRNQFKIPVIAITGSVGKTTTKELVAAVLATQGSVLKTQANYNNEIGVPKTLLELEPSHDYAVIEMGMRAAGEIVLLTQIARPDIALITNVGTAHIGILGSEQAIANAKCELLQQLQPTGTAILNQDNDRLIRTAAEVWQGKTITYGLEGGDLQGEWVDAATLRVDGIDFKLPLPGRHNALNYLAALAVAKALQINWESLTQELSVEMPKGRSHRRELPHDIVILDETYNAGLESMIASLHLLAETPAKRRIAVLGTMKELGDRSPEFHHQVGVAAQQLNLDALLILADAAESQAMAAGAGSLPTEQFSSHDEVVERLRETMQSGDRILFKASRAVGLDQVVEELLKNAR
ncbi:MAG: UDP-N-acetylmuramoyl-tripeptide--D-alanyl-D-alanine ligase [Drouetiella hepatica Uher 2000/2452]|jgi:UDP-N-acetylmuramoyl-tripeptide--D-alanyl-D-alanine ligase|uniref:UDP-N-acetylmuramoyl-tripeptide--D-alanyl-D-alanine ligase n=1 Tax=Drouetiella hepatica Uher 2000/2452 TaxID=904376 RepID=A0A951UNU2_9CYAN|nr:UDP-N-acetylmuramoyl-tripeptide--D-alanyl-D-alanine ligase [Drouetiella hepatica Uher 2000/2452]